MADVALEFLLENLKVAVVYYADLISGAKGELEKLTGELDILRAHLQEAAKKPYKREPFKVMERQIRKVVYEVEDTLDTCLIEAAETKGKRASWRKKLNPKHISLAEKVRNLRKDKVLPIFNEAKMKFVNMPMGDESERSAQQQPTSKVKKDLVIREDNVVGLKDQEDIVMDFLTQKSEELDIFSIVGMPGLGKTTLTWKIFQSPEIKYQFPTRIWVYVSEELNRKDVLKKIMQAFTGQDMSAMSEHDLAQTCRHHLKDGTFLLVLDDVWKVEHWNAIKDVLPFSNSMGKVLITTRQYQVGEHAHVGRKPHKLRFLTEDESWKLLWLEVFKKLKGYTKDMENIGKRVARQCDGLPLAVVVVGGILVDSISKPIGEIITEWTDVSRNVSKHIKNNKEYNISEIVAMSYNNLPDELRDCFVYLGVFPEDYEIPAWTLTRLWIAEGLIQRTEEKSFEGTAEEILNELINRNLVMVEKLNPSGEVKTCRVHDVIREFCILKAGNDEHDLFQEIKLKNEGVFHPPVSEIKNYRRLCIHSNLPLFLSRAQKGGGIRSFLSFYKESFILPDENLTSIPDFFELLRVLDTKSFKFPTFPTKLGKLIHLRYVTLSCDELEILPESITALWNIQTLVVDTKSRKLEIQANIWNMIQLRHFKTKASIVLASNNSGDRKSGQHEPGENLQTLSRLSPESCTADVFRRARNLKKLGIRGKINTLLDTNVLDKLERLENLKLLNDLAYGSVRENPVQRLPQHNFFPPNLKRLTLSATYLDWKHMSTLGMISTLQVLKLRDNAFRGDTWNAVSEGFPVLHFLLIATSDLVYWSATDDQFPNLRCLVLKNCGELMKIPLTLAKSLEILDIERVSKSAADCAREIENEKKNRLGEKETRWGGFKLSVGPGCGDHH